MDLFKTLGAIVLGTLNKKQFDTDESGHLVLSGEEAEKLDTQMKYAGGEFSATFKSAFDKAADANTSGETAQSELVITAFVDAIRAEATAELHTNMELIKRELQREFDQKLTGVEGKKTAAELKATNLENQKMELEKQNGILSARTEPDTKEAVITEQATPRKKGEFKVNRKHYHNKMAFDFLAGQTGAAIVSTMNNSFGNKTMGGGPNDTIDVSEINEEFGTYISDPATRFTIFREMLRPTQSRTYMTKVLAINEWRDAQARIDSIIQQFVAIWTPLGKVKYTPLKIVNRRHKINMPIVPDDITGGYLTYLYNEELTPDQMSVTQYIIDMLLRPRISDDIEYKMIANGKYVPLDPTDVNEGDAGQATGSSMDGFLTILADQAADPATKVNFWTPTVPFTEDNSVEYFEAYAKWIKKTNPTLGIAGLNVYCDPDMEETRRNKYREMFPFTKEADFGKTKIDFSNITIVPLENMRGSGVLFSTPQENFIELHHINEASGATKLFLQLQNYEVRVFGEFWLAVGFAVAEWVFAAMPQVSGD